MKRISLLRIHIGLLVLFFLSGAAALAYQVAWQRLLFTTIGVDIESVTIIVSVFMFGLGVGSLLGGVLADAFLKHIIVLFALFELGIGTYGLLSPWLIDVVGEFSIGLDRVALVVSIFALMSIPTILMGATLPMLVVYLNRSYENVGVSIGGLYFANTLGACLGAYSTGFLLFARLGLDGVIYAAVACNVLVSVGAYVLHGKQS